MLFKNELKTPQLMGNRSPTRKQHLIGRIVGALQQPPCVETASTLFQLSLLNKCRACALSLQRSLHPWKDPARLSLPESDVGAQT